MTKIINCNVNTRQANWRWQFYRLPKIRMLRHFVYFLILKIRNLFCNTANHWPEQKSEIARKKRILIIRPDHIGDFLLSLPGIMVLMELDRDEYSLEIVINPCNKSIVEQLNIFDQVFVFNAIGEKGNKLLPSFSEYQNLSNLIGPIDYLINMLSDRYTLHLDFWLIKNIASGISYLNPKSQKKMSESNYQFLSETAKRISHIPIKNQKHYVEKAGELLTVKFAGGLPHACNVIFCPEARSSKKTWPSKKIGLMVDQLTQTFGHDFTVTIVGHQLPKTPFKHPNLFDFRGLTSIEEVFAMIATSSLFIGFDSGLTHFSSMVGTPSISIFNGATDPDAWGSIARGNNLVILAPSHDVNPSPHKVIEIAKNILTKSIKHAE